MTSFAFLPNIVATHVFKYLISPSYQLLEKQQPKHALSYLNICHEWRVAALPLVYRTVFVENMRNLAKGTDNILNTNATLAAETGNSRWTRVVNIELSNPKSLILFLNSFRDMFQISKTQWPKVFKLRFSVDPRHIIDSESKDAFLETACKKMSHFADCLVEGLPRIRCFEVSGFPSLDFNRTTEQEHSEFYSSCASILSFKIMQAMSKQLTCISCNYPIEATDISKFNNLTYLKIDLENNSNLFKQLDMAGKDNGCKNCIFSAVNKTNLKTLKLANLPQSFTWCAFQANNEKRSHIYFKNLHSLYIDYANSSQAGPANRQLGGWRDDSENSNFYKVHFPKLKSLFISGLSNETDFTFNDVYPKSLDYLFLDIHDNAISQLADINFNSISKVKIKLNGNNYHANQLRTYTQKILGANGIAPMTTVVIYYMQGLITGLNDWSNLKRLKLKNLSSHALLLEIIQKLPYLAYLSTILTNPLMPEDVEEFDLREHLQQPIAPLHSNLRELKFLQTRFSGDIELSKKFIKQLILQLPSLEEITIPPITRLALCKFASKFSYAYPHLSLLSFADTKMVN